MEETLMSEAADIAPTKRCPTITPSQKERAFDITHEWRVRLGFPHEAMFNISMVS
jgi:hypothetical protein